MNLCVCVTKIGLGQEGGSLREGGGIVCNILKERGLETKILKGGGKLS